MANGVGLGHGISARNQESRVLADALSAIGALNARILEAIASAARRSDRLFPLDPSLRGRFAALTDVPVIGVRCGVLLADLSFSDSSRWQRSEIRFLGSESQAHPRWLTSAEGIVLTSAALMLAWHVVHAIPTASGILLGMPRSVSAIYQRLTVNDFADIAMDPERWMRPRWADRLDFWSGILDAAEAIPCHERQSVTLRCLKASTPQCESLVRRLKVARVVS
jgi:hypothetical protein